MVLDIPRTTNQISQPRRQIRFTQSVNEVAGRLVERGREGYSSLNDLLVDGKRAVIVERRESTEKFVGKDTECPPVDCSGVSAGLDDFRREVFGCATISIMLASYN